MPANQNIKTPSAENETAMITQSTNHLLLIEPAVFYANPETMTTNVYQVDEHESHETSFEKGLDEFHRFRDMLVANGVTVTTVLGSPECPDHIFPNWASTHENGKLILYPMLNDNRRAERSDVMIDFFTKYYDIDHDFSTYENQGKYLESTGSLCLDRVNRVAYAALSDRTSEEMVRLWGEKTGYDFETFHTRSHTGKPVYHTDLTMWIGTEIAAICADAIVGDENRERILSRLQKTHNVVELTLEQMGAFCGNSLEIVNQQGEKMLVMSENAYFALTEDQKETYLKYFVRLLYSDIHIIEKYGGGSARCLIMEMF